MSWYDFSLYVVFDSFNCTRNDLQTQTCQGKIQVYAFYFHSLPLCFSRNIWFHWWLCFDVAFVLTPGWVYAAAPGFILCCAYAGSSGFTPDCFCRSICSHSRLSLCKSIWFHSQLCLSRNIWFHSWLCFDVAFILTPGWVYAAAPGFIPCCVYVGVSGFPPGLCFRRNIWFHSWVCFVGAFDFTPGCAL